MTILQTSCLNPFQSNIMQGHPTDLFLKISVLQANFSWLGDVEKKCPWKESVAGKYNLGCLRGFDVQISYGVFVITLFSPLKG